MAYRSLQYIVSGKVHDVGFRQFVRDVSKKNRLVGWVKNDPVSEDMARATPTRIG